MTTWLIDKSALVRLGASPDAAEWASCIQRGLVRITTVTRLEVGYSARTARDLRAGLREPPVSAMPVEYLTPAIEDRAVEVLTLLAGRGQHRAPSIPDLLIAATAEFAGHVILHCDKDFDLIASITGQPAQWLATPWPRTPPATQQHGQRQAPGPAPKAPGAPSGGAQPGTTNRNADLFPAGQVCQVNGSAAVSVVARRDCVTALSMMR